LLPLLLVLVLMLVIPLTVTSRLRMTGLNISAITVGADAHLLKTDDDVSAWTEMSDWLAPLDMTTRRWPPARLATTS